MARSPRARGGRRRILTVGTTVEGCRTALDLAERHDGVFAILGSIPTRQDRSTIERSASCASS